LGKRNGSGDADFLPKGLLSDYFNLLTKVTFYDVSDYRNFFYDNFKIVHMDFYIIGDGWI